MTVIASSKHTKLQFVLHSIQGYDENKSDLVTSAQNPQRLLITLQNKLELPALLGREGPVDLIPAPFVVTIPASEAHWLVAALASSFLSDTHLYLPPVDTNMPSRLACGQ